VGVVLACRSVLEVYEDFPGGDNAGGSGDTSGMY
jgi:hypothetical protein